MGRGGFCFGGFTTSWFDPVWFQHWLEGALVVKFLILLFRVLSRKKLSPFSKKVARRNEVFRVSRMKANNSFSFTLILPSILTSKKIGKESGKVWYFSNLVSIRLFNLMNSFALLVIFPLSHLIRFILRMLFSSHLFSSYFRFKLTCEHARRSGEGQWALHSLSVAGVRTPGLDLQVPACKCTRTSYSARSLEE